MERDTNQRQHRDEPFRFALDYDDRDDTEGHWEDGHRSGALACAVTGILCAFSGSEPFAAAFGAAAVICACLPRWRRH